MGRRGDMDYEKLTAQYWQAQAGRTRRTTGHSANVDDFHCLPSLTIPRVEIKGVDSQSDE